MGPQEGEIIGMRVGLVLLNAVNLQASMKRGSVVNAFHSHPLISTDEMELLWLNLANSLQPPGQGQLPIREVVQLVLVQIGDLGGPLVDGLPASQPDRVGELLGATEELNGVGLLHGRMVKAFHRQCQ